MNYFFVFQNKTFEQESRGGYLWAPCFNKQGRSFFHWENMKHIKEGDLIFHSYKARIAAISIAKSNCSLKEKPLGLDNENLWERKGYYVETNYIILNKTISTLEHLEQIYKLQPKVYGPFNQRGGNTGYLFNSNKELSQYLLNEILKVQTDRNVIDNLQKIRWIYA